MALRKNFQEDADVSRIIAKFRDLSKEDKISLVSHFANELKRLHGISEQEILGRKDVLIPISIFAGELSSLEAVVKYMKENLSLKFSKAAKLLNRSSKTIWATYHKAAKKMPSPFIETFSEIMMPVSAISNRSFSTLESVVGHIKALGYTNHETALMMNLDDRTIWTVYDRVKKKRGMKD